jgi:hypothetical protein
MKGFTMKKLIWFGTAAALVVWSLIAWVIHGLVGVAGNLASSNADILPVPPEAVEWTSWLALLGTSVGEWLVVAVWAIVSLVIAGLGFAGGKLAQSGRLQGRFSRFVRTRF